MQRGETDSVTPARTSPEDGVRIPEHVVYRSFPTEVVVLNLETGSYHGLNPAAGRMLVALEKAGGVRGAATALATELARAQADVEHDLLQFCNDLAARGLVVIDSAEPQSA